MNNTNQHIGSALDNLLEETGELAEISAVALERVESWEEDLRDPCPPQKFKQPSVPRHIHGVIHREQGELQP